MSDPARQAGGESRAGGEIRFRVGDGAAFLGLNRPAKRNAMSQPMWEAIREALAEAAADPEVRAFVIEGLPGTFCAWRPPGRRS